MSALSTDGGEWVNKIKLSEAPAKVTNPGVKKIYRLYDRETGKMKADLITLEQCVETILDYLKNHGHLPV